MGLGFIHAGICQQRVPILMYGLGLPIGLKTASLSLLVGDATGELSGQQLTSNLIDRFRSALKGLDKHNIDHY